MGQFGRVSVFRKIAFPLCALKAATQCSLRSRPPRSHFFPSGRTSARQRSLNQKASSWNFVISCHPRRAEKYLFDHIPRLRCRQSIAKKGGRPVHVSIENFSKELLLVAKCGVKTRSIDSHGPCEIGECSAFITFRPKTCIARSRAASGSKARGRPRCAAVAFNFIPMGK